MTTSSTLAPQSTAGSCQCQPDPALGAPPACWLQTASHRERLDFVVAALRYYAVTVAPGYDGDPDTARAHLIEVRRERYPYGTESYVFWTAADEQGAFADDGRLVADLTLRHSADTRTALTTALDGAGLAHTPGQLPDTLTLSAAG